MRSVGLMKRPTLEQIADINRELGFDTSAEAVDSYRDLVEGVIAGNATVDELPDDLPPVTYQRSEWHHPDAADNPLNAWYVRTHIQGSSAGKLAGRTVAVKDNVFVADIPMMNGTRILEGYTPPVDATVVTRMLDAAATIVGKSVCEAYCFSGGSHTSASGPVLNPLDTTRSAGGSSSGSGALVAAGEADLAVGCDQGGSIRIPASFCGICGLKPTHGLVPYTGILGFDPNVDHVGPMTGTIADNALLLEVLAGADGVDSRQYSPPTARYTEALGASVDGVRIGVLSEGFERSDSEPDVDAKVRTAAELLGRLGANVTEVSVPMHRVGPAIAFSVIQSALYTMFQSDGCLLGRLDPVAESYLEAQRQWRQRPGDLPETVKVMLIASEFLTREYGYRFVARGVNQTRRLRAAYDAAFDKVDLLLMPTTPMKATRLPPADAPREVVLEAAFAPLSNTVPFDNTHHPALSMPCGISEGLPVGMMLVGRHFEESLIYSVAHAFEQHRDWREL